MSFLTVYPGSEYRAVRTMRAAMATMARTMKYLRLLRNSTCLNAPRGFAIQKKEDSGRLMHNNKGQSFNQEEKARRVQFHSHWLVQRLRRIPAFARGSLVSFLPRQDLHLQLHLPLKLTRLSRTTRHQQRQRRQQTATHRQDQLLSVVGGEGPPASSLAHLEQVHVRAVGHHLQVAGPGRGGSVREVPQVQGQLSWKLQCKDDKE